MDSEPSLGNSGGYTQTIASMSKKVKPYISFEEMGGVKQFDTISMVDDTESLVFSSAKFDDNYHLLHGELYLIELERAEYMSIKNRISDDFSLADLVYCQVKPRQVSILNTGPNERRIETLVDEVFMEGPNLFDLANAAIDDYRLRSVSDRINNYLIRYGTCRNLSVEVFKEIEAEKDSLDNVITFQKAKKIAKTA